jgi:prepilin peptidase CpaA
VNIQVWIAILVGLAAMIDDLARRQIANWIPLSALAAGFGWQIGQSGLTGLLYAAIGTVAGFAIFLIFYLLGGMGGGDVKLMAGFGALLGFHRLLEAALWTAGMGGVIAVGVLGVRSLRGKLGSKTGGATNREQGRDSIPYAPAIALGVWLSLVPKG